MNSITDRCRKCAFTLLEVVIVISLIALTTGAFGWQIHHGIAKKRFTSSLDKLRSRLCICHRLAINMQADWTGVLTKQGKQWVFEASCPDSPETPPLSPLALEFLTCTLDGQNQTALTFDFTSTGEVYPKGTLSFFPMGGVPSKDPIQWKVPELFLLEEGETLGPIHPREIKKR